ncbi:hypothetical protein [Ancylobacter radicis]|uniref:Uncharacterized protein n=1 Tax=Ancylobacter radicis TaxID=2836179 RepID=A0ABS5R4J5_9HYPH|nr:hypothetical protein [Ancylobacter radicis]MBS9476595.1 hypothetical protein [Ancylobacter radicis]
MSILKRAPLACAATAAGLVLFLAAGSVAMADKAAGDACAASLNADGQAIYAGVGSASGDLRTAITNTTRSLAMSGKIDRGNARTNAEAAGKCLELARS